MNRKGHLTKPQEAVHVENVKNDLNFKQAGAELGQAQLKLDLGFTSTNLH